MWFFARKTRRASKVNTPRPRCRLEVETLEDRCLLSAGALDPTFGTGGRVVTSLSTSTDHIWDMAIQPDGKIIAVGETYSSKTGDDFALVRYNPNGTLDTTFGTGGKVTTNFNSTTLVGDVAYAVAVQLDGKIIAAGYAGTTVKGFQKSNFALARYNPNGTLDSTFGSRGKVITVNAASSGAEIEALVLQADGTIVVAGSVSSGSAAGGSNFALARYTAAGALDTSFGSGGTAITDFGGGESAHALTIQADGRIVVTGQANLTGGGAEDNLFATARYNRNGSLDASFGSGGKVTTRPGLWGAAYGVTVQADGRIVAGGLATFNDSTGTSRSGVGLIRYNANGSLDNSFGVGGLALAYDSSAVQGVTHTYGQWPMALQADGKIVMAGNQFDDQSNTGSFLVGRFSSLDGGLDPSFGNGGWVTTSFPACTNAGAQAIAIQSDGKIVAAGYATNGFDDFALARYLPAAPVIGSFTASPNPVTAGSSVTLTASNITDANPGATITQVNFYVDSNNNGVLDSGDTLLTGTSTYSNGTWTLTFSTTGWASGTHKLFAQALDSYGVLSDPFDFDLNIL